MGQTTGDLPKDYTATTAVPARTLVKFGAADGTVIPAVIATGQMVVGVAHDVDTAIGERCSVFMSGIADVIFGGTVARGDAVTCDGSGRAITTTTVGNRIVGFAEVSGVVGDIGTVIIAPGVL